MRAVPRRQKVKVYGLLRCGTNYLSALVEQNYRVRALGPDDGGWKHGPIAAPPEVVPLLITKDPYTWLESFHEWERIHNRTAAPLLEFATAPLTHLRLAQVWSATDPIDAWNKATRSWLEAVAARDVLVVRYEDLLEDFRAELQRFEHRHRARRRSPGLSDISERVDVWETPLPRRELDRQRYRPGEGPPLDPAVRRVLDARLERDLLDALGYLPASGQRADPTHGGRIGSGGD